jgi:hypothetical protein
LLAFRHETLRGVWSIVNPEKWSATGVLNTERHPLDSPFLDISAVPLLNLEGESCEIARFGLRIGRHLVEIHLSAR